MSVDLANVVPKTITYTATVEVSLDQGDAAAVDFAALNDAVNASQQAIVETITAGTVRTGCHTDAQTSFVVSSGVTATANHAD